MNLLIIFSDQQHKYALGKVDPLYKTPNLDALADEGVLFTNAYSNNPVCGPFRGCLMTGLPTSRNGLTANNMPLPGDVPLLAQRLRAHGWQTGFVGKWHLGGRGTEPIPEEIRGGFERFRGYQMYNGYDPAPPYHNRVAFYDENNVEHLYQEHRTEVTTRLAVEMLGDMAAQQAPFCLMVGYQAPHYPEQPLPEYDAMYSGVSFPVDEQAAAVEPYTPTYNPPSPAEWSRCPDYRRYGGSMAEYKRLYAAMVTQLDHGVGEIVRALKRKGLYEETLIIFTSDHGDMQGSHGLKNKCVPYEQSAGIPLIVRYPGGRRGQISSQLAAGIDIFSTAMDVAGEPYRGMGHSFLPYVKGETDEAFNNFIISESLHGQEKWQMVRTPQHKLVMSYPDGAPVLLFDMAADPQESHNLLETDRDYSALVRSLQNQLVRALQMEVRYDG